MEHQEQVAQVKFKHLIISAELPIPDDKISDLYKVLITLDRQKTLQFLIDNHTPEQTVNVSVNMIIYMLRKVMNNSSNVLLFKYLIENRFIYGEYILIWPELLRYCIVDEVAIVRIIIRQIKGNVLISQHFVKGLEETMKRLNKCICTDMEEYWSVMYLHLLSSSAFIHEPDRLIRKGKVDFVTHLASVRVNIGLSSESISKTSVVMFAASLARNKLQEYLERPFRYIGDAVQEEPEFFNEMYSTTLTAERLMGWRVMILDGFATSEHRLMKMLVALNDDCARHLATNVAFTYNNTRWASNISLKNADTLWNMFLVANGKQPQGKFANHDTREYLPKINRYVYGVNEVREAYLWLYFNHR